MGVRHGFVVCAVALLVACGTGDVSGGDGTGNGGGADAAVDTSGVPSDMVPLLERHQSARAEVGSPPLTWNAELAASAQEWADTCTLGHDPDRDFGGEIFGENIAAGSSGFDVLDVAEGWFAEKESYDCAANSCSGSCGHYTQIIWRSSTELGCAQADCGGARHLVCRYLPAGNFIGERPVPVEDCP